MKLLVSIRDCEHAHLSVGKTLQEVGLAAAIGADEAISAPDGQLYGAVLYELDSIEAQTEAVNFDIPGCRPRCQDACNGPL